MSRLGTLVAGVAAAAAVAMPASASAASWNCDAAALSGSVLGAPAVDVVTANRGQPACRTAMGSLADLAGGLPLPLAATTLTAQTFLVGPSGAPDQQKVTGVGGL